MSNGSEKRPQTKMFWSDSTKKRGCTHRLIRVTYLSKLFKAPVAKAYD